MANFFSNHLRYKDLMEKAKKCQENLRRVRSQNDMNKAVPQPPLFPILDFNSNEFPIWEASEELSCDKVVTETENWEECTAIMEILFDDVTPGTENLEETAKISKTFLDEVIIETENWEESAAIREMFLDDFIPETENWEASAPITETFL